MTIPIGKYMHAEPLLCDPHDISGNGWMSPDTAHTSPSPADCGPPESPHRGRSTARSSAESRPGRVPRMG